MNNLNPGVKPFTLLYQYDDRPTLSVTSTLDYWENGVYKTLDVSKNMTLVSPAGNKTYYSTNDKTYYITSFADLSHGYTTYNTYMVYYSYKVNSTTTVNSGKFTINIEPNISYTIDYSNYQISSDYKTITCPYSNAQNSFVMTFNQGITLVSTTNISHMGTDKNGKGLTFAYYKSSGQDKIVVKTANGQTLTITVK